MRFLDVLLSVYSLCPDYELGTSDWVLFIFLKYFFLDFPNQSLIRCVTVCDNENSQCRHDCDAPMVLLMSVKMGSVFAPIPMKIPTI